jgi:hypothetical protein
VERVKDPTVEDEALTPVERVVRAWRAEVLLDLGGPETVSAAKTALVDAALGTRIMLDSLDRYLFELAAQGGLVNRRNRRAFAIVADRMRVADSLTRQLGAVGLDRVERPPLDLSQRGRASASASDSTLAEGDDRHASDHRSDSYSDPDGHAGP